MVKTVSKTYVDYEKIVTLLERMLHLKGPDNAQ